MIPVSRPLFAGNEKKYLEECISTGWISSEGPFVKKFEKGIADYVGRLHGVALSSGSAALDLAFRALDFDPGDEVIVPALTIISCASAIVRAGARPVLVDSDDRTFNMDPDQIRKKITSRTRAILVVHLYGLPCDMKKILEIAREFHLRIIEDAAEALGLTYDGKRCGSFGDISVISFYANKTVTSGEGGMILTDDEKIFQKCRSLRDLAHSPERRFFHLELGWNYRMTNLQAAVGLAQLEQIDSFLSRKREIGGLYEKNLEQTSGLRLPLPRIPEAENVFWVYPILVNGDAEKLSLELRSRGVDSRPFFVPLHLQPALLRLGLFAGESYPVAESLYRSGLYLPSGLGTTDSEIRSVCETLTEIIP